MKNLHENKANKLKLQDMSENYGLGRLGWLVEVGITCNIGY
jgi:hypothetical protein